MPVIARFAGATFALTLALTSASALVASGCASRHDEPASRTPEPAPEPAPPPPPPHEEGGKARAPVALELVADGAGDALTLTLRITATAPIPRAVARFTLPEAVTSEDLREHELGALAAGEARAVTIRARVSAAATVVAGVDCHLASGVKLYRGTALELAPPPAPAPLRPGARATATRELSRHGLRAAPARRATAHR